MEKDASAGRKLCQGRAIGCRNDKVEGGRSCAADDLNIEKIECLISSQRTLAFENRFLHTKNDALRESAVALCNFSRKV